MGQTNAKVSIIGCGNVGMRYAYAMLIKNMARELVLIDIIFPAFSTEAA